MPNDHGGANSKEGIPAILDPGKGRKSPQQKLKRPAAPKVVDKQYYTT